MPHWKPITGPIKTRSWRPRWTTDGKFVVFGKVCYKRTWYNPYVRDYYTEFFSEDYIRKFGYQLPEVKLKRYK